MISMIPEIKSKTWAFFFYVKNVEFVYVKNVEKHVESRTPNKNVWAMGYPSWELNLNPKSQYFGQIEFRYQ